jgi:hypothetical protein
MTKSNPNSSESKSSPSRSTTPKGSVAQAFKNKLKVNSRTYSVDSADLRLPAMEFDEEEGKMSLSAT